MLRSMRRSLRRGGGGGLAIVDNLLLAQLERRELVGAAHVGRGRAHRAPVEIGARLHRQSLMLDVADDMSVGLEYDLAAANGALDPPVDDDGVGLDAARDRSLRRDNERGAVQIAL